MTDPQRENGALGISNRTDDELSRELLAKLLRRFEAAREKDSPEHSWLEVSPISFKLSRHGTLLVVNKGQEGRLIEITVLWTHNRGDRKPWRASIFRSLDRKRLALIPGPEGGLDDIVEEVVRTVLIEQQRLDD